MSALVAYYGTPESDAAVQHALTFANITNSGVIVLIAPRQADGAQVCDEAEDRLWNTLKEASCSFEVRRAREDMDMVEQMIATAQETESTLIVLGLRSGGSGYANLGQTATRLLLDAPIPVLTTRAIVH